MTSSRKNLSPSANLTSKSRRREGAAFEAATATKTGSSGRKAATPAAEARLRLVVETAIFQTVLETSVGDRKRPDELKLKMLLIGQDGPAEHVRWALPGDELRSCEDLSQAADRVAVEASGLECRRLEQLRTYLTPEDEQGRRLASCVHLVLTGLAVSDGPVGHPRAVWFEAERNMEGFWRLSRDCTKVDLKPPTLGKWAGRLEESAAAALEKLELEALRGWPIFELMPEMFTVGQLQSIQELILGRRLLGSAFRRKVERMLSPTGEYVRDRRFRPSQLFRHDPDWLISPQAVAEALERR
ncbi:MAG: hypothetical protein LBU12_04175 [Deltaproteobacteria bacterium]|jgi:ADP-ribose pyrophosphatase YjhB (NUDIX family)|nr:hypothetical protein [Deltaproteobacteria bacterium]